jgi:hypothetical protein
MPSKYLIGCKTETCRLEFVRFDLRARYLNDSNPKFLELYPILYADFLASGTSQGGVRNLTRAGVPPLVLATSSHRAPHASGNRGVFVWSSSSRYA